MKLLINYEPVSICSFEFLEFLHDTCYRFACIQLLTKLGICMYFRGIICDGIHPLLLTSSLLLFLLLGIIYYQCVNAES